MFRGWGVCLTRPPCSSLSVRSLSSHSDTPRPGINLAIWWCGSLFYTPLPGICLVVQRVGSLSYTPGCLLCQVVQRGSLTHPVLECVCSFGGSGVSVTVSEFSHAEFCPVVHLQSVSSSGKWELILNAPCWSLFVRRVGSFFYTPRAGICLVIRRMGSHSYTPCAAISLVIW